MAFLKVEDETGQIEVVVFPKVFVQIKEKLASDKIIIVKGKTNLRDETVCVIADDIWEFDLENETSQVAQKEALIYLPEAVSRQLLTEVYECLKSYPGDYTSFLVLVQNDKPRKVPVHFKINPDSEIVEILERLGCKLDF